MAKIKTIKHTFLDIEHELRIDFNPEITMFEINLPGNYFVASSIPSSVTGNTIESLLEELKLVEEAVIFLKNETYLEEDIFLVHNHINSNLNGDKTTSDNIFNKFHIVKCRKIFPEKNENKYVNSESKYVINVKEYPQIERTRRTYDNKDTMLFQNHKKGDILTVPVKEFKKEHYGYHELIATEENAKNIQNFLHNVKTVFTDIDSFLSDINKLEELQITNNNLLAIER